MMAKPKPKSLGNLLGTPDQSVGMVFSALTDRFLPAVVLLPPSQSKPMNNKNYNGSKPEKITSVGATLGFPITQTQEQMTCKLPNGHILV